MVALNPRPSERPEDDNWQRLINAKPRLASDIKFYTQQHRGFSWVVVHNPTTHQFFKTTALVKSLLVRFDGSTTLKALIASDPLLADAFSSDPHQFALIAKLMEAGIVSTDLPLNHEHTLQGKNRLRRQQSLARWLKPWFFKFSLFNPDVLLTKLNRFTQGIWAAPIFYLWLGFVVLSGFYAWDNGSELKAYWRDHWWQPANILIAVAIYPILKGFHEIAHGLSVKKWGGHVYDSGLAMLFFLPVPYVDASASLGFANKYQRMAVAGAGIITELLLAAIAFWVWLASDALIVREICFNVMLIGTVASLFFNGNPLLRYDGYYILCEYLEIPNLSQRSRAYLGYCYRHYCLGIDEAAPFVAPGERKWLIGYGLTAGVYRVLVSFTIAFIILGKFFFVGIVLGIWALLSQLVTPLARSVHKSFTLARTESVERRFFVTGSIFFLVTVLLIFFLPVRSADRVAGLLMLPGEQELKAATDGFIEEVLVAPGELVYERQPLARMVNHELSQQAKILEARLAQAELLRNQQLISDATQAGWYTDEIKNLRQELMNLNAQIEGLTLYAPNSGRVQFVDHQIAPGVFVAKGAMIAALLNDRFKGVFVLNEAEVWRLQRSGANVQVRLRAQFDTPLQVHDVEVTPRASDTLPHRFLSKRYGGDYATDPGDPEGLRTLKPVFLFNLDLQAPEPANVPPGSRLVARIVHQNAPLARRLYDQVRKRMMEQLGW